MVVWEVLWEGVEEEVAASVLQAGSEHPPCGAERAHSPSREGISSERFV